MSAVWDKIVASWKSLFRDETFREKLQFLRNVFLFSGLNEHMMAVLVRSMVEKTYREGETIFEEGDVGRAFFVIASGKVRVERSAKGASPEMMAEMGPGDFFGEMVLLDELPRSATATAVEPTTVYILYKTTFDELLLDAPKVASKFLHSLARLLSARLRRENLHAEGNGAAGRPAKARGLGGLVKKFLA